MKTPDKNAFYSLLLSSLLNACSGGVDDGIIGTGFVVNGTAEKGPFIVNSNITVNLLNNDGTSKTDTLNTQTKDDLGNFSFTLPSAGGIQISANGYHFNEITGDLSDGPLTLYAVYNATEDATQSAYVNVLTHLVHNRVLKLMKDGKPITEAIDQAQKELITELLPVLPVDKLPDFAHLRIYNTDDTPANGNAYLLALSATIYQYVTSKTQLSGESESAELSLVLNSLASDLANDGLLNSDPSLISDLVTASRLVDPSLVEKNLKLRSFRVIREQLAVPNINLYLDTDGDGTVNAEDTDDDNDGIPDIQDSNPYRLGELDITIVQPAPDSGSSSNKLRAIVADDSLVQKIEYLIDGEVIGESSEPPYEVTWDPYFWSDTTATYSLITRITDAGGNKRLGPEVELTVPPITNSRFEIINGENTIIRDSDSIELEWKAISTAEKYEIEVRNDSNPNEIIDTEIVPLTSHLSPNLLQGTYSWRIRAANGYDNWGPWSDSFKFIITGPLAPTFISPVSGTTIVDTDTPTFIWDPAEFASGYEIELASDPAFTSALLEEISVTSFTSSALPQGQYYVRIRSKNNLAFWGEWGETTSFTLSGPNAPLLISPKNNGTVGSLVDVTFSWSISEHATDYAFQLSKSSAFATVDVETQTIETTSTHQLAIGKYYWRVRAKNDSGFFGEWSDKYALSAGIFTKNYGGPKADNPSAIKETRSGGYIIVGGTQNGNIRNQGIYLLKISPDGIEEWHQTFDTADSNYGRDVIELTNGNFILIGTAGSWPNTKLWLIETNSAGDKLSERFIENETFGKLVALDNGYVLGTNLFVSETTINSSTYREYVPKIVRYDLSHNELWSHTFDESVIDFEDLQSLKVNYDGDFVIVGTYDPTPDDVTNDWENKAYVYTLSQYGDAASHVELTDLFIDYGNLSNKPLPDGSNFIAVQGMGTTHALYNSIGEKTWSLYPYIDFGNAGPLITIDNDNIEVVQYGERYVNGSYNHGLYRFVYDTAGYTLSEDQLINDGTSYDRANGIRQIISTSDGGYVLLSSQTISGNTDILVTKIDSNGNMN